MIIGYSIISEGEVLCYSTAQFHGSLDACRAAMAGYASALCGDLVSISEFADGQAATLTGRNPHWHAAAGGVICRMPRESPAAIPPKAPAAGRKPDEPGIACLRAVGTRRSPTPSGGHEPAPATGHPCCPRRKSKARMARGRLSNL